MRLLHVSLEEIIEDYMAVAYFDVLLQILGTLEGLSTEVTLVWLQWDVNSNVRGDMVTFYRCGPARIPATGEVQVVGTFSPNMLLTDMLLLMH
jgi:hypothetical protein